jgi:hypothetical protein
MKNLIFLSLFAVSIIACNSKGKQTEDADKDTITTEVETPAAVDNTASEPVADLYSCPMHPEVKGKKDSECPKCGMALTEPVK